ncbi:MAG: HEAT repeat domain-containing protein [Myxococcota bacterium]
MSDLLGCGLAGVALAALGAWMLRDRKAPAREVLGGEVGGVDVRVARAAGTVEVSAGGVDPGVVMRRQGVAEDLLFLVEGPDHHTGDPLFDEEVYVNGPPARLAAALDPQTRRVVQRFVLAFEGRVSEGRVRIAVPEAGRASLPQLLDLCVEVARRLAVPPEEEAERLREIARHDPIAAVRTGALTTLARHHATVAERVAREMITDAAPEVRLEAACVAGEAGLEHLLDLVAWESAEPAVRVRALDHLAGSPLAPHLRPYLPKIRACPVPSVRAAALMATASAGEDGALRILLRHANAVDPGEVAAATRALGALGDPAAEAPLIALLGHAVADVRIAAVEALARVGTVRAVEPLLEVAGGVLPGAQRRAVRAAVAAIHVRLGDVEAGRVSMADGLEGAVTVAPTGRLTPS